jgi:glycosyltransferase involved in cell wall biosynthesis
MKVSIITVVKNNVATIEDAITSVASQSYPKIEHIMIDGASTDGTIDVIDKHIKELARVLSEPDRGIYDAMNKGLGLATGDIIGFLNADDFYADTAVVSEVVDIFLKHRVDAVFGDLVFVAPDNLGKTLRYYESKSFNSTMIARGWMPAHPTLFIRKPVYEHFGYFKVDYDIAADFEFVARIFGKETVPYYYFPKVMVKMRQGGVSTKSLKSTWILNKEILRACRENGIRTNVFKLLSKYPRKILGLINKSWLF